MSGFDEEKVVIRHDNAPRHKSIIAMAKINELKLELLPSAPFSPGLAPSDDFLFPNLEKNGSVVKGLPLTVYRLLNVARESESR